jgi:hypothetical protein
MNENEIMQMMEEMTRGLFKSVIDADLGFINTNNL